MFYASEGAIPIYFLIVPMVCSLILMPEGNVINNAILMYALLFIILGICGVFASAITYVISAKDQNPQHLLVVGLIFLLLGILLKRLNTVIYKRISKKVPNDTRRRKQEKSPLIKQFPVNINEPVYHEQWFAGTYLYTGIFPKKVENLQINQIKEDRQTLYDLIRQNRKKKIHDFWGLSGYYLIPIYFSNDFDSTVIEWVRNRPKYKRAIWHEPVLYSIDSNSADMNTKWGLYGSAFRPYIFHIIDSFLHEFTTKHGYRRLDRFCGEELKVADNSSTALC